MASLPIEIDRYFFTRFCVISNPGYTPEGRTARNESLDATLEVAEAPENASMYIAQQRVKLAATSPEVRYTLDVECIGFFKIDPNLPDSEKKKGVTIVAHNILYAAVREAILTATARQPWGPLSIGIALLQQNDESKGAGKIAKATLRPKRISKAGKKTKGSD